MYCPNELVCHVRKPSSRLTNVIALGKWKMGNSPPSSVSEQKSIRSHGFRGEVYKKRKQIKNKKSKTKPSLTKRRMELANYALILTQNLSKVDFAFVNILCNLKINLKERYQNKFTHFFNSKDESHKLLNSIGDVPSVDE